MNRPIHPRSRVGPAGFCTIRGGRVFGRKASRRGRTGFSIIEVMTATSILLVGFVGLIQAVTIGSEALDTARKQQAAHQIISAEIEKLRGGDWSRIANLPGSGTLTISPTSVLSGDLTAFGLSNFTVATSDDNTSLSDLGRGFTCSFAYTRTRPVGGTSANVTFVKLVYTVTWKSNTGRSHRHTVETYLGKNGLHLSNQQS